MLNQALIIAEAVVLRPWRKIIPGTIAAVQDSAVGALLQVKEILCLLGDAALFEHVLRNVLLRRLHWTQ